MKCCNNDVVAFLKNVCISENYAFDVLKASNLNTYVETLGNKADGLHYHLDKLFPDDLSEMFFKFSKPRITRLKLGIADLIADITEEDFYGDTAGIYIHGWTGEDGVKGKFRYLVVAALFRNQIIPFYVAILPVGCFKADYLGQAVDWFNSLGIKARKVIMDKGFYSGDIINTLQLKKMKYLIFAPKKKLYRCMLESVPDEGTVIQHEIPYTKDKSGHSTKINLALIKDYDGYDWIFATSLVFKDVKRYIKLYKQRWNIETMFRVHDEAKIKTKSVKTATRLFYFIISMLFLLLWNIYQKNQVTFKLFVMRLYETYFCKTIGIDYTF